MINNFTYFLYNNNLSDYLNCYSTFIMTRKDLKNNVLNHRMNLLINSYTNNEKLKKYKLMEYYMRSYDDKYLLKSKLNSSYLSKLNQEEGEIEEKEQQQEQEQKEEQQQEQKEEQEEKRDEDVEDHYRYMFTTPKPTPKPEIDYDELDRIYQLKLELEEEEKKREKEILLENNYYDEYNEDYEYYNSDNENDDDYEYDFLDEY